MFQLLKLKVADVRTLTRLCTLAEEISRQLGQAKPGSEHYVLAALALPDKTAVKAFEFLGINVEMFREALASQRSDALAFVGVVAEINCFSCSQASLPLPKSTLYKASPSGQSLLAYLSNTRKERAKRRLLSADILLAAAQEQQTPTARAFRRLGLSSGQIIEAVNKSIDLADHLSNA